MIHIVLPLQKNLRYRNYDVAVILKILQYGWQRLRRVERGIVEETDGPGLHLTCYPLGDLRSGKILPVQTVTVPYSCNPLRRKGLRGVVQTRYSQISVELRPPFFDTFGEIGEFASGIPRKKSADLRPLCFRSFRWNRGHYQSTDFSEFLPVKSVELRPYRLFSPLNTIFSPYQRSSSTGFKKISSSKT